MQIRKLMIANRGEIALRVARTCHRLGIETVAIVAPDDGESLHARSATQAVAVGSYLDIAAVLVAASEAGVDAVHPGYGFLAESADFAEAVTTAGITWVGPSAAALRLGGDKLAATRVARAAGVPTLPQGSADEIGFPLVVKAAAGGGGRGMRVVRVASELDVAVAAARREAEAAFGDGTVFLERYLERPRHIEAQLLGHRGGIAVLGARDCSIQRRHQKLVEESPPIGLDPLAWPRIEAASIAFAKAIDYLGAGTAEFLVDGSEVYFLELNGRIQVEHPVTEAVTGLDLVELQLRVAAGENVDLDVGVRGHAIEVRLYAEDPRTFLPQSGRLERLVLPSGVRVDSGVAEGDEVGTSYDPLLAKLIAHGADRNAALGRLEQALAETVVEGVTSNLPFLRWLLREPAFRTGGVSTAFLVEHPPLRAAALLVSPPAFAAPWRLNLPPPAVAAPPDVDVTSGPSAAGTSGSVSAPMPGTVIAVEVAAGDSVRGRQTLVVLEAMKMEMPVVAPFPGVVTAVLVRVGDSVSAGAQLVDLAAGAGEKRSS